MKLAVIYDSKTGNTKTAAEWIVSGMTEIPDVEAKAFPVEGVDEEYAREAKGIVIGSPAYVALMTPNLHNWMLGQGMRLAVAGKLGGAFATEQYTHGGGDVVIQNILTFEITRGMLCYSGGNAEGTPCIHLGPIAVNNNQERHNGLENYREVFRIYGKRFAKKAVELFV